MDFFYSATLLVSLASGGAALLGAIVRRVWTRRVNRLARAVRWACAMAWLAVSISVTVHLAWGHTPGTLAALPLWEFVRAHVAFVVAAALPAVALLVGTRCEAPQRRPEVTKASEGETPCRR